MSLDAIARGLANKAQNAIAEGNLPYAMSSNFGSGTVGRKLQEVLSARDFGAKGDGKSAFSGAMTAGSAVLAVSLSGFPGGFVASDIGKIVSVPGAAAAGANLTTTIVAVNSTSSVTLASPAGTTVSGKQITFGTDDTSAMQAFVTYLANNMRQGFVPGGTYCLNGPINTPHRQGWGISGNGPESTIFSQFADNVPIIDLGAGTTQAVDAGGFHTLLLEDFRLSYAAPQPVTNTSAACLAFSSMVYWSTIRRITFEKGYDGIKVRPTRPGPWGSNWDDLRFRSSNGEYLSGCAMDWTGVVQGCPNNRWGRMTIEMGGMSKPAFNQIRGYNWEIDTLEFLGNKAPNSAGGTGQMLLNLQSGSQVSIGSIKLETFDIGGPAGYFANNSLIYVPSCIINIRHLSFSGNTATNDDRFATTGTLAIIGGPATQVIVDTFVSLTNQASNIVWSAISGGVVELGNYYNGGYAGILPLTSIGGGTGAEFLTYRPNAQRRLSPDIGDANYAIATNGGANVIMAQTALTASRTVEIMADSNYLHNGYTVTVISRGAVNGANTLVIKAGGITKATLTADNTAVELTWRRNPTAHNGWVVTRQGAV
ncbi:hypothetical protein [Novosphingobium huizhouense]|uniref:hypothetical protein n=1 Tax=Novosphingobium huizhouense TaxID=2866625 RepID=UPI001CD8D824|nr:hypothetical protein [Novosphingobium huizhouense]